MTEIKKSIVLMGSPRCEKSNSNSLAAYMMSKLEYYNVSVKKYYLYYIMNHEEKIDNLLSEINKVDLVILVFPLYFDCYPASVLKMMELLYHYRESNNIKKKIGFSIIVNCGFPEAFKNETVLKISRIYAKDIGFIWKGGLSIGAGEVIGGRPIEDLKGMARNLKKGFDIAAKALALGEIIPQQAIDFVSKPFIPKTIYLKVATLNFKKEAKKNGVKKILRNQPYLEE